MVYVDSVHNAGQAVRPYHHGRLRDALIEAGLDLTRSGGPDALGLREVTRRVGVSPNAAYRHFADRRSLLEAVAGRVRQQMADTMAGLVPGNGLVQGPEVDPGPRATARLRAVGVGYIDFALTEPGWFDVAFAGSVFDPADPGSDRAGSWPEPEAEPPAPYAALVGALDALVDAGLLAPADRAGAEWPCWSAVHGFAVLAVHGPLAGAPVALRRRLASRTVDTVITGLLVADRAVERGSTVDGGSSAGTRT